MSSCGLTPPDSRPEFFKIRELLREGEKPGIERTKIMKPERPAIDLKAFLAFYNRGVHVIVIPVARLDDFIIETRSHQYTREGELERFRHACLAGRATLYGIPVWFERERTS